MNYIHAILNLTFIFIIEHTKSGKETAGHLLEVYFSKPVSKYVELIAPGYGFLRVKDPWAIICGQSGRNFANTVSDRMRAILQMIHSWRHNNELTTNAKKTQLVNHLYRLM